MKTLKKVIYIVFVLAVLFVPQILSIKFQQPWSVMLILFACSFVTVMLSSNNQIKHFKLGASSLEIDTERIEKAINDAYATIDMVKDSIAPILEYTLRLMPGEDIAFGGTEPEERIRFFNEVVRLMKSYSISGEDLTEALIKARSSVVYSFDNDLSYVPGIRKHLSRIFTRDRYSGLESVNMEEFRNVINEINVPNDKQYAQQRYEQLSQFLNETGEIN